MNPRFLVPDISLAQELAVVFTEPFKRLTAAPDFTKFVAIIVGTWQFVFSDLQIVAGLFMLICAAGDFWSGTKVAKLDGLYTSVAAHRGMATKVMSLLLVLLVRLAEQVLFLADVGDTKGMLAVTAAVAFGIADMRSIMYHREALGAAPIPIISSLLDRISAVLNPKASESPDTPRRRHDDAPPPEAGEGWEG